MKRSLVNLVSALALLLGSDLNSIASEKKDPETKSEDLEENVKQSVLKKYYCIDDELYQEYESAVDISIADYTGSIVTKIPISINLDGETIYLISPSRTRNYQLPIRELKSNYHLVFRVLSTDRESVSKSFEKEKADI